MADTSGTDSTDRPPTRTKVRLTDISSRTWEHPADRGALVALRQLKGFDLVLRKLASLWNERSLRLVYIGNAVRVDDRQFAKVQRALADVAAALDVKAVPEVYVIADPVPRAMALGVDAPFIVLTSGMLHLVDDEELRFVVGHELGHVLSGHALYTTMLMQLMRVSASFSWFSIGALGIRAIVAALHEWQRKAELSGDRAGLLAVQDPGAALRLMMKMTGGGTLEDLDVTAFAQQGDEYLGSGDVRDSVLKLLLLEARSHPFAVVRAAEMRRWVDSGAYTRILAGEYPRRADDESASIRADVADAARHYRDAFERSQDPLVGLLKDLGGTVAGATDWLTSRLRGNGNPNTNTNAGASGNDETGSTA
jgi:Zn-dependent protease with chaperone function